MRLVFQQLLIPDIESRIADTVVGGRFDFGIADMVVGGWD
jgi:hypothetical protein